MSTGQLDLDGGETPRRRPPERAAAEPARPWHLVTLNTTDYDRATEYAYICARNIASGRLTKRLEDETDADRAERPPELEVEHHELGAQGELAVARLLGTVAPLDPRAFSSRADIPPHWDVKTQSASSRNMQAGYLRLRPRNLIRGRRHVLVERDVHLRTGYVFLVHGFITTERAREVGTRLYANTRNLHVHRRHLEPLEPLGELDVERLERIAARWYFDDDGNLERVP